MPLTSVVLLPHSVLCALKSPAIIKGSGSWFKITSTPLTVKCGCGGMSSEQIVMVLCDEMVTGTASM